MSTPMPQDDRIGSAYERIPARDGEVLARVLGWALREALALARASVAFYADLASSALRLLPRGTGEEL